MNARELAITYLETPLKDLELSAGRLVASDEPVDLASVLEDEVARAAWSLYLENAKAIRKKLCIDYGIESKLEANTDNIELALLMADLLVDEIKFVSPIMVAVIIIKKGLRKYCEGA